MFSLTQTLTSPSGIVIPMVELMRGDQRVGIVMAGQRFSERELRVNDWYIGVFSFVFTGVDRKANWELDLGQSTALIRDGKIIAVGWKDVDRSLVIIESGDILKHRSDFDRGLPQNEHGDVTILLLTSECL